MNNAKKTETKSKYIKADSLLPKELLKEIQKYAQGQLIYIPKEKCDRKKWGVNSGGRKLINERNNEICRHFRDGTSVEVLADRYFLSAESIKRIVYKRKNRDNKIKEIRYI
ncbi:MAG: CD3324 family protein [Oscillospiraceae bacterium]|nr:CD3324 family protein [Oscillospiraceae bacterium]